ncbi:Oidioi.mRNA.OKI2018_I69.PAR.g12836.t1.cds [Oikopleura dioica]|uniref:Oidioi.mRNA.OKI2018_I69.PAR.g12836.t1.cds n=1 Tax=Oikopleura dioica TaxID=34765 RepID=A0ABN7S9M4_OIKDI|nr:Oidioi.mRNA.OKI2018_I69.PAR.g12836.t1.cds [Oikopleura dioica]
MRNFLLLPVFASAAILQETCTNSTKKQSDSEPYSFNFLILLNKLPNSFIISHDGLTQTYPTITGPSNSAKEVAFAVIKNELYIFGGREDNGAGTNKIVKLVDCSFEELSVRSNYYYAEGSAALTIQNGEKALICFGLANHSNKCEEFDTIQATITHSSQFGHRYGHLGYYNGKPTTVSGDGSEVIAFHKVESLSENGWLSLADHPPMSVCHTLTGLESGAMILTGGYYYTDDFISRDSRDIWLLKDNEWTIIGKTKERCSYCSSIRNGQFVYIVSGSDKDFSGGYPIERIEINDDVFVSSEVIGHHSTYSLNPVLYATDSDFCVLEPTTDPVTIKTTSATILESTTDEPITMTIDTTTSSSSKTRSKFLLSTIAFIFSFF